MDSCPPPREAYGLPMDVIQTSSRGTACRLDPLEAGGRTVGARRPPLRTPPHPCPADAGRERERRNRLAWVESARTLRLRSSPPPPWRLRVPGLAVQIGREHGTATCRGVPMFRSNLAGGARTRSPGYPGLSGAGRAGARKHHPTAGCREEENWRRCYRTVESKSRMGSPCSSRAGGCSRA